MAGMHAVKGRRRMYSHAIKLAIHLCVCVCVCGGCVCGCDSVECSEDRGGTCVISHMAMECVATMFTLASFPGRFFFNRTKLKIQPGIDCIWAWQEPETKELILHICFLLFSCNTKGVRRGILLP